MHSFDLWPRISRKRPLNDTINSHIRILREKCNKTRPNTFCAHSGGITPLWATGLHGWFIHSLLDLTQSSCLLRLQAINFQSSCRTPMQAINYSESHHSNAEKHCWRILISCTFSIANSACWLGYSKRGRSQASTQAIKYSGSQHSTPEKHYWRILSSCTFSIAAAGLVTGERTIPSFDANNQLLWEPS